MAATSSNASLDIPVGNSLVVNDTVLDIAWTQDGNLFRTQANNYAGGASAFVTAVIGASGGVIHDTPNTLNTPTNSGTYNLSTSDFDTGFGTMSWWGAQAWVNYLNTNSYAGVTGWRLPQVKPVNGVSLEWNATFNGTTDRGFNSTYVNATASEMAHLYYNDLGNIALFNTAGVTQSGSGLVHTGPFSNIEAAPYWFGNEYLPAATSSWVFSFGHGGQGTSANKAVMYYAFAVHEGQIAAVPVPGAVWLMASAIAGLFGCARKRLTA